MLFKILIAILNRYYNFSNPNDLIYTYWYAAETATAVYVGNVPLCWQFISHVFQMGSWATFASDPRPPEQGGYQHADRAPRRRLLHSMLPASLWSTHRGTYVGGDGTSLGLGAHMEDHEAATITTTGRRMGRTQSEEAIMADDVILEDDGREEIELSASRRTITNWTPPQG